MQALLRSTFRNHQACPSSFDPLPLFPLDSCPQAPQACPQAPLACLRFQAGSKATKVPEGFCPVAAATPTASGGSSLSPNSLGKMLNECVTTPVKAHVSEEHDATREGVKQAVVHERGGHRGGDVPQDGRAIWWGGVESGADQAGRRAGVRQRERERRRRPAVPPPLHPAG